MGQTVAYVRVSTEDQVEFSPDAQAKRCRELARLRDLGSVRVLSDEGWSGKNLDRPAMRELLHLVRLGTRSEHVVIWRLGPPERVTRATSATLVKLFEQHEREGALGQRGRAGPGSGLRQDAHRHPRRVSPNTFVTRWWRT